MFALRCVVPALRSSLKPLLNLPRIATTANRPAINSVPLGGAPKNYSTTLLQNVFLQPKGSLLAHPGLVQISNAINSRTVIKFSIRKGRRKSVRTVLRRFYRLHWGGWIRTIAGRHKRLYKKRPRRRERLKQHVLCNATQCRLLDKMVGSYWRKPRYYVDDPYEPYHTREEFPYTARKPKPYFPPEQDNVK